MRLAGAFTRALLLVLPLWLLAACTQATLFTRAPAPAETGPTPAARMQAAEERYRQALIALENGNPAGVEESDLALEDMEDALHACNKAHNCAISQLLVSYKRLLKLESGDGLDDSADDEDGQVEELADADLPPAEGAASANADGVPDAALLLGADNQRFVQMVQMNPAVQAGIRRWLTDLRANLITSHENYQYMQHLMSPAFSEHGLPEALLFGIMAKESNGRVHSYSRAGAAGPLQFMPGTGRRFGLGVDASGFDTRYDAHKAADAAARYLKERLHELGPEIEYWLAAYNGGEGRARRVHAQSGGRNFWDEAVYQQFPPETRDYVPMVIAAAWLYLHPEDYGLRFPEVDPRPATITLTRAASIYELTICLGNDDTRDGYLRVLRNLNPGYRAETWIPAGTELAATERMAGLYRRWCSEGDRAALARQLIEADPQTAEATAGKPQPAALLPTASARIHRVKDGETLGAIARRHRCNLKTLASANNVRAPRYFLRAGQRLRLEGCAR